MATLPYYPLTNVGCNDAAKMNADLAALLAGVNGSAPLAHGVTPLTIPIATSATAWGDSLVTQLAAIVSIAGGVNIGVGASSAAANGLYVLGAMQNYNLNYSTSGELRCAMIDEAGLFKIPTDGNSGWRWNQTTHRMQLYSSADYASLLDVDINGIRCTPGGTIGAVNFNASGAYIGTNVANPNTQIQILTSSYAGSVYTSSSASKAAYYNATNNSGKYSQIEISGSTRNSAYFSIDTSGYAAWTTDSLTGMLIGAVSNVPLILGSNNAEIMRLTGINTLHTTGDVAVMDLAKGIVLKQDTGGHYFRIRVNSSNALYLTDLGTSYPP